MYSKRILPVALTALLMLTVACGDKKSATTEPSGDTLSEAEFDSMVDALDAVGGLSFIGAFGGRSATSSGLAAQTYTAPYDETSSCPNGGTIRTSGNFTYTINNNTSFHYTGTLTQTFNSCKGASSNGTVFTFSGGPKLVYDYTFNSTTSSYTFSIHETGTLNWATSAKGGACAADVTLTGSYTAAGVTAGSYTGTICGRSVNQTF
jgi:hypothetical protein